MVGQHIVCRLEDDQQIAKTEAERSCLARVVLKVGRAFGLLAFALPDTHLHLQKAKDGGGELARRIQIALQRTLELPVPFVRVRPKPLRSQWHFQNLFTYVLGQQSRHGLANDPFHVGSSWPDLLGMRVGARYLRDNVELWLPRVRPEQVAEEHGIPLVEASEPLELVPMAAAAAVGLPALVGKSPRARTARRAALAVFDGRLAPKLAAALLGISDRALRRLRPLPVPVAVVRATRLQLGLRRTRWDRAVGAG